MNDLGLIAAILSPFFSSISTVFKAEAAKDLSPVIVVSFGGILGSAVLLLIAKIRHEKLDLRKLKLHAKDILLIAGLRFLLGELLMTYGLVHTTAIKAIFFTKIEPYFVLILGWFLLKEKVKRSDLNLLAIHLVGALMLSTGGRVGEVSRPQFGDLLIILSMLAFASTYTVGKRISEKVGSTLGSAIPMLIASVALLPFALISSPKPISQYSLRGWEFLIIYVLLFNVFAITLWFFSLKTTKGWIVSSLRYIGPVLGAPAAYFLFGQKLDAIQIVGALIIISTSYFIVRRHISTRNIPVTDES